MTFADESMDLVYAVDSFPYIVQAGPVLAEAFPEYRLDLLQVQTARRDQFIAATTLCQRAQT